MATNYTGDEVAIQPPAPQPTWGARPISSLPDDGDALDAASVAQAFKVVDDYLAFVMTSQLFGPWGRSTTDLVVAADTDLTGGHQYFRDLTINAGKKLNIVDPGILFVSGTLTFVDGASRLFFGKPSEMNGGNAAASAGGGGGVGWNDKAFGAMCGGGSGGRGGDFGAIVPVAGGNAGNTLGDGTVNILGMSTGLGGAGGAGGAGGHAGAAAGIFGDYFGGSPTWDTQTQTLLRILLQHGFGFRRGDYPASRGVAVPFGIEGGAGGGGGGGAASPGNAAGGGGGAGGAVGIVFARRANVFADGNIQAPGGNGGNGFAGTATGGGGGAGGGGFIGLATAERSGPAISGANSCPAGTPGAAGGAGTAGAAAANGRVAEYLIGF